MCGLRGRGSNCLEIFPETFILSLTRVSLFITGWLRVKGILKIGT